MKKEFEWEKWLDKKDRGLAKPLVFIFFALFFSSLMAHFIGYSIQHTKIIEIATAYLSISLFLAIAPVLLKINATMGRIKELEKKVNKK